MHHNKKVLLTAVEGRGSIVFENATELAKAIGIKTNSVYAHLNNSVGVSDKVTYKGRKWFVEYLFEIEDEEVNDEDFA